MTHLPPGKSIISKFLQQGEELRAWSDFTEYDCIAKLKNIKLPFPGANFTPTLKQELKIKNIQLSRGLFFLTNQRIIFAPGQLNAGNFNENNLLSLYHSSRKNKVIYIEKVMWARIGFLGSRRESFLIRASEKLPGKKDEYFAFGLSDEYARVSMKNIFSIFE